MQPLMNFSTNNFNPYQQPMYQPMQNPYMDRMQMQNQQMAQTQMPGANQGICVRVVDNFDSITANDVPMNGGSFFVKSDGSLLEYRKWTPQGTIEKTSYLARESNLDSQTIKSSTNEKESLYGANKEVLEGISNKVDSLSDRLDEFMKIKTPVKAKKEVATDE